MYVKHIIPWYIILLLLLLKREALKGVSGLLGHTIFPTLHINEYNWILFFIKRTELKVVGNFLMQVPGSYEYVNKDRN